MFIGEAGPERARAETKAQEIQESLRRCLRLAKISWAQFTGPKFRENPKAQKNYKICLLYQTKGPFSVWSFITPGLLLRQNCE
jgi:hypothetical protein